MGTKQHQICSLAFSLGIPKAAFQKTFGVHAKKLLDFRQSDAAHASGRIRTPRRKRVAVLILVCNDSSHGRQGQGAQVYLALNMSAKCLPNAFVPEVAPVVCKLARPWCFYHVAYTIKL